MVRPKRQICPRAVYFRLLCCGGHATFRSPCSLIGRLFYCGASEQFLWLSMLARALSLVLSPLALAAVVSRMGEHDQTSRIAATTALVCPRCSCCLSLRLLARAAHEGTLGMSCARGKGP